MTTTLTDAEVVTAKKLWTEYQQAHDLSGREGQAAGIDPKSGNVWIDRSILDVVALRDVAGYSEHALRFERVGYPTCYRK